MLQPLQPEAADGVRQRGCFFRLGAGADAAEDVFLHRHIGEQGVVLEKIPQLPLLWRQVDPLFAVKQHPVMKHDPPPIRGHDPRDAFEGHALAAAGGPQ